MYEYLIDILYSYDRKYVILITLKSDSTTNAAFVTKPSSPCPEHPGEPVAQLNTKKSDALTKMLQRFSTNASRQAAWNGELLTTPQGPVTADSLTNTPIK